MPLLDRSGLKPETFARAESLIDAAGDVIVPWANVQAVIEIGAGNHRLGVDVPNNLPVDDILPLADKFDLISVPFPSFADGRGFSIARQLRDRGYRGVLRAQGKLIADQFAYALACGFDEVEPADDVFARQPVEQWLAAASRITAVYQRGYNGAANILDQRRAARAAKVAEVSHV
ncbi:MULTISPECIES: DUF934 domain-containing protein [unclassified Beijerinckia]|uniref:DUF934 domain-containing protein n=1 Tax=unclassified Beijerinckia TaxID=2638183 RepID=UPI000897C833|nr:MULTISPECIES: DUF934 domain-containing protein [unclassified Beijerinckia]MDH7794354.1 uncharacterized protein (DUF934 family) [Beijerinckia sp. GAS462]SEB59724.1 Uncharacterized conserved protein, DUF934 family [Beijerinckia sp. 28-YEA-48]